MVNCHQKFALKAGVAVVSGQERGTTFLPACRDAALLEALIAVGMPVASGPPEVSRVLLQHTLQTPALLCPALLRAHIRADPGAVRKACTARPAHAAALLGYCLQDVDERDARSCAELLGAQAPLFDGPA